jgi:hypothetical protein
MNRQKRRLVRHVRGGGTVWTWGLRRATQDDTVVRNRSRNRTRNWNHWTRLGFSLQAETSAFVRCAFFRLASAGAVRLARLAPKEHGSDPRWHLVVSVRSVAYVQTKEEDWERQRGEPPLLLPYISANAWVWVISFYSMSPQSRRVLSAIREAWHIITACLC